jgi:outer membrane immunogenic protein
MALKKQILTGLASLTLFDIAVATAVAQTPSWAGTYIGAHAGYRWADAQFSGAAYLGPNGAPVPAISNNFNLNSGILGLHAGYNYLISPNHLFGLEGDFTWGWGKDSLTQVLNFDGTAFRSVELGWQSTLRGRLGVINGNWLLYGTGGVAFIHAEWADRSSFTFPATSASWSSSKTLSGWVVGAGAEYMVSRNWIARVEYLYENFGSFNVPHGFAPQTGTLDIGDVHKLRAGISYKFGS